MGDPTCGRTMEPGTLRTSVSPGLFFLSQGEGDLPGLLRVSQKMPEDHTGLLR